MQCWSAFLVHYHYYLMQYFKFQCCTAATMGNAKVFHVEGFSTLIGEGITDAIVMGNYAEMLAAWIWT